MDFIPASIFDGNFSNSCSSKKNGKRIALSWLFVLGGCEQLGLLCQKLVTESYEFTAFKCTIFEARSASEARYKSRCFAKWLTFPGVYFARLHAGEFLRLNNKRRQLAAIYAACVETDGMGRASWLFSGPMPEENCLWAAIDFVPRHAFATCRISTH